MLNYPIIDPVAVHLGPLSIHWYGLMYLIAFFSCWSVLCLRLHFKPGFFTRDHVSDLLFYVALGVILGGRLGYMIFYDWNDLIHTPWRTFMVWQGGMSFHGGLIGVIIGFWWYAQKINKSLGEVADLAIIVIPIGLLMGRIGNFINSEIYGRVTDMPWGMIFPNGGDLPRHPSQLYEAFLEGIVLFIILWIFSRKPRPPYSVSSLFLVLYGIFRFSVEFFREPDVQIGFIAGGWLTEGQLLSIPLVFFGMWILIWSYRRKPLCVST